MLGTISTQIVQTVDMEELFACVGCSLLIALSITLNSLPSARQPPNAFQIEKPHAAQTMWRLYSAKCASTTLSASAIFQQVATLMLVLCLAAGDEFVGIHQQQFLAYIGYFSRIECKFSRATPKVA